MAIVVYSTKTCPWCQRLKEYLKERKVSFIEKEVSSDFSAQRELVEKSGQMGVPVTIIDHEKVIVGFDEEGLEHALRDYKPEAKIKTVKKKVKKTVKNTTKKKKK